MRFRLCTITTSILLSVLSAAVSTFTDQLPSCWQTCIEKRGPQCASADLKCLCHFAATPTLLPTLLTCVRKTCDTKYYPEFLTAPLQAVQTACSRTQDKISDTAVSKAESAAESAYSDAVVAEKEGWARATRTRVVKSWGLGTTATNTVSSISAPVGASKSDNGITSSTATSTAASSSVASVGPRTGTPTISDPFTASSASSGPSTSTSVAHDSSGSGGTPLDVGQQGASVKKRAGNFLCLVAAVFVGFA